MAAAVNAPAEVLDNMEFFSDFELLANLDILEEEQPENGFVGVSTAPAIYPGGTAVILATETVKVSTVTRRSYEKR
jgi:hypothetical protein